MQVAQTLQPGDRWWIRQPSSVLIAAEPQSQGPFAFAGLVAFTAILLLAPQNWLPLLAKMRIATLSGGAAIAFLLWDCWSHRRPLLVTREIVICLVLAGWAVITMPLSFWPGGSIGVLTDLYLKAVIVFFLIPNIIINASRLRFIALTLVLCTLPLAFTSVKNYVTGNFIAGSDPTVQRVYGYKSGLAGNPNDLALMLNLIIPLGIAIILSKPKRLLKWTCIIVVALDAAGVILTMSRAGFLGLSATAIVYFFRLIRRPGFDQRLAIAAIVLVVLSLPFLPSNYTDRISTIAHMNNDRTGSAQARWQGNVAAVRFIMQRPLVGAGIGMGMIALNTSGGPLWHDVHNVYLQYAVDLGLPGLILFVILLYLVFSAARNARGLVASDPEKRDLFLIDEGLEVSLIVFALCGLFHPVAYHFYFYYIGGLALAARAVTQKELAA